MIGVPPMKIIFFSLELELGNFLKRESWLNGSEEKQADFYSDNFVRKIQRAEREREKDRERERERERKRERKRQREWAE